MLATMLQPTKIVMQSPDDAQLEALIRGVLVGGEAGVEQPVGADVAQESPDRRRRVREDSQPTEKWGSSLSAGFQVLPDTILRHYTRAGLSAVDLAVLLQLTMAWWQHDEKPYPRVSVIARRVGVSSRSVQRSLVTLRRKELVGWSRAVIGGEVRRCFDLSGLSAQARIWAQLDLELMAVPATAPQPSGRSGVQTRDASLLEQGDR